MAGGAGSALDCKVNAEAGASEENDFEDDKPREYGKMVGVCGVVVEIIRVILVHIPGEREGRMKRGEGLGKVKKPRGLGFGI